MAFGPVRGPLSVWPSKRPDLRAEAEAKEADLRMALPCTPSGVCARERAIAYNTSQQHVCVTDGARHQIVG